MKPFSLLKPVALCAGLVLSSTAAFAEDFPKRPIDLVVGFKAGGGTDTYARALASAAGDHTNGQPIVIVNKPGGGGVIAGRFVADQPANGYTLYLASAGSLTLKNLIKKQVASADDFKMVGTIGALTAGVFVPASSEIKTLEELFAKAKSSKSKLRWGHTGRGNTWHVAGLGLLNPNEVKAKDIPFKGGSGVRSAITSADVDFGIMGAHLGRGFEDDVRLLAVLSNDRHPAVPDAPTAKDLGVNFVPVSTPMVVMAPKNTDDAIVAKLSDTVSAITKEAGFIETLEKAGLPVASVNGPDTAKALEISKKDWAALLDSVK